MGWNKKVKFWPNERLDLPDIEKTQTNNYQYLGQINKKFRTLEQYIVSGFITLNNGGLDIKVVVKDSVMFNIESTVSGAEGTLWIGSGDVSIDPDLTSTLANNATNYVELELYTEDSAPDTRAFWDPTANSGAGDEYNQVVNTCTTLKCRLQINTTAFSGNGDYIPISTVVTSGGSISSIEDSRPLYNRLNTDYTWPDGRTVPASTDFIGADKSIVTEKQKFDAICTVLKEIKGSEWYEAGVTSLSGIAQLINSCLAGYSSDSKFAWASGVLSITDDNVTPADADVVGKLRLYGSSSILDLTRQDGAGGSATIPIADGEVMYVTLPSSGNRTYSGVGSLDTNYKVVTRASYISSDENYWIAYREGSQLIARGMGELESGEELQIGDGIPADLLSFIGSKGDSDSDPDYLNSRATAIAHIHSVIALAATSVTTGDCFLLNSANNSTRYYVWANKDSGGGDPKVPGYIGIEYPVSSGNTAAQVADAIATAVDAIADFSAPTTGTGTILITNTEVGACDGAIDRNSGFTLTVSVAGVGEVLHGLVEGENLTSGEKRLDEETGKNTRRLDAHFGQLQILELDTPDQSVNITGGDTVKDDRSTLVQTSSNLMLKFRGCNINFNTGVIVDELGASLGIDFTPTAITASEYFWYSITLLPSTANSDNTIGGQILILPASSSGETPELAPKAPWSGSGIKIGQICVRDNGSATSGSIENITQDMVYQLGTGGGGGGGGTGDASVDLTRYENRLNMSPFEYVTANIAASDEDDKLDGTSTAIYDIPSASFKFPSIGSFLLSSQMLDPEFLADELDINKIELYTLWELATIDTAATYEVSRDGGNEFQTISMTRVGLSNAIRGTLVFEDEATNGYTNELTASTTTKTLQDSTNVEIGQKFTLANATVLRDITIDITASGSPVGLYGIKIVKDDSGAPSTDISDLVYESPLKDCSDLSTGTNAIAYETKTSLAAGDYHLVYVTDTAYKTEYAGTPANYIAVDIDGAASSSPYLRVYNGTTWGSEVTGEAVKYSIEGRELDLRVKITSSVADVNLSSYGIFYNNLDGITQGQDVLRALESFNGTTNPTTFTLDWYPDSRLISIYQLGTGQVFRYGDFAIDGRAIIFPDDTFNVPGETITLEFFQISGINEVPSSVADNLLTANHLGSEEAALDKSVAGRGILLRAPGGQLKELVINDSNEIEIYNIT